MGLFDSYLIVGIVSLLFLMGSAELALKKLTAVVVAYKQLKAIVQGDDPTEEPKRARLAQKKTKS